MQRPSDPPASQADFPKRLGQMTLDVTVTDPAAQPVSGLSESDFTVLDNHQAAKVISFRAVEGAAAGDSTQAIIVLDEVNNTFQSVATERDQIVKFLRRNDGKLPMPISLALFSDSGVKMDQPTQDGGLLISELEKMPIPVHTITSAMGGEGAVERYQLSLKTLNSLVAYAGLKQGRKLLLWIGPGWPMMVGARFTTSAADKHANWDEIVLSSRAMRDSRTTLYSINSLSTETGLAQDQFYKNFLKPVTAAKDTDSGNLALPVLALQSGGKTLNGSNDLAGQIASCIGDASAYYTITIQISTSETVNEYHPLEVKVERAGLTARTNTGYYDQPYIEQPPSDLATLAPATTLREQVRLVVVDAVVLDKKGAPVTGLKAADFVLKEDGVPQKLASVEEHKGMEGRPAATDHAAGTTAARGPAAESNGTISASNKPINAPATWNILLVDQFNTTPADQALVVKQLRQFVKQLPADEPVALVVMSSQMKVLVPFADGAAAIVRFLDSKGLISSGTPEPPNIRERGEFGQPSSAEAAAIQAQTQTLNARTDIERQGQHAQKTLDNFSALATWLIHLPGRKNVFWLSSGFPLQGQPVDIKGIGLKNTHGQPMPIQATTDKELESARVAIYPIDARGVAPPDYQGETTADTTFDNGGSSAGGAQVALADQLSAAKTSGMMEIAKATGGMATFNNDIVKTLRNNFDRSESYYTISYTPSNTDWNGSYRRMNLTLDQPGYQLLYRQGYFAKDPEPQPTPTKEQFRQALQRGAASATDVLFSAKVNKTADSATVNYKIDAQTIQYQADASGKLAAAVDCVIVEYDFKGKPIATSLVRLNSAVDPARRAALNADGLRAEQSIALKPGAASLVLGLRDQVTGRFGNLDVPLAGR